MDTISKAKNATTHALVGLAKYCPDRNKRLKKFEFDDIDVLADDVEGLWPSGHGEMVRMKNFYQNMR